MASLQLAALSFLALHPPAGAQDRAHAQPRQSAGRARPFAGADGETRAAVCPTRGACELDFVLPAGQAGGASLAVVRVRTGRRICQEQRRYRDFLVAGRAGRVRRLRELARGESPCLEWQLSSWTFDDGELVFTYGGMGAPPAAGTDMRPVSVHLRPWPLAVTGAFRANDRVPAPVLPPSGPVFRLSME